MKIYENSRKKVKLICSEIYGLRRHKQPHSRKEESSHQSDLLTKIQA